jgi:hypothetical protein
MVKNIDFAHDWNLEDVSSRMKGHNERIVRDFFRELEIMESVVDLVWDYGGGNLDELIRTNKVGEEEIHQSLVYGSLNIKATATRDSYSPSFIETYEIRWRNKFVFRWRSEQEYDWTNSLVSVDEPGEWEKELNKLYEKFYRK